MKNATRPPVVLVLLLASWCRAAGPETRPAELPAWAKAHEQKKPMTAGEARAFMKRLAQFAYDQHLRKDETSPQRGMLYEYLDFPRRGQPDQFVQGEALDTMHDGAWFAAAMANASRATGDPFYKDVLMKWQLPFYCRMLNESDRLFSPDVNHAGPGAHTFDKEHMLQKGEKGFVPYFWDDGGSVSLERRQKKTALGVFACYDDFVARGQPNPQYRLSGYSLGSSNHMAQDLGVMLQTAWLLLRESQDEQDKELVADIAEAAKNLQACRARHGAGNIPAVVAPAALASGDPKLLQRLPNPDDKRLWTPSNHYTRALYDFKPGQRHGTPGFADDQQYRYYSHLARSGGKMIEALAFSLIYDAYTERLLYHYYSDDAPVPPGIDRFDLHPYHYVDGKPADYRSDRKGPHKQPRPIGSRLGPQNMIVCGWALQAMQAFPDAWEARRVQFKDDHTINFHPDERPPRFDLPLINRTQSVFDQPFRLVLASSHTHLHGGCLVERGDEAKFELFARPDVQGSRAVLTLHKNGRASAINDKGEALLIEGEGVEPTASGFAFSFRMPYSIVKGQKTWANAIEHGRMSVRVGGEGGRTRNLYFSSHPDAVSEALMRELTGGLRTWEAIVDENGFIPTGLGTRSHWDAFSDSGGYAHLISAAAQWVLLLEGKRDWEVQRYPAPA